MQFLDKQLFRKNKQPLSLQLKESKQQRNLESYQKYEKHWKNLEHAHEKEINFKIMFKESKDPCKMVKDSMKAKLGKILIKNDHHPKDHPATAESRGSSVDSVESVDKYKQYKRTSLINQGDIYNQRMIEREAIHASKIDQSGIR
jgi:hypothetical protein